MTRSPGQLRKDYAAFSRQFVPHPRFDAAFEAVEEVMSYVGVEDEPPNLPITGPTGIGKTTLIRRLRAKHPVVPNGRRVETPGCPDAIADDVPLLAFEFPSQPTVISVGRCMLKQLGDPRWRRGDRDDITDRVDTLIRACGVRVALGDEAQRMVDRNGEVRRDDLADWFKERHASTGIALVFVGLGRLRHLIEKDDQIERRWDAEIRLDPYRWLDPEGDPAIDDQADFIGVVLALQNASPVPFADDLRLDHEKDAVVDSRALRFYYASWGVIGYVVKLVKAALRIVIGSPASFPVIDLALLEKAYVTAFRVKQKGLENPFALGWQPFNRIGKPNLPPPLKDDSVLLTTKRRRQTKREKARALSTALTAS